MPEGKCSARVLLGLNHQRVGLECMRRDGHAGLHCANPPQLEGEHIAPGSPFWYWGLDG